MHIGIQLVAPGGTASLSSGTTYYLFANGANRSRTVLTWFEKHKEEWRVDFICVAKAEFESSLLSGALRVKESQATLPPWLERIEGRSIDSLEDGRVSAKKTYRARATERYEAISFLEDEAELLAIERADAPKEHILKRLSEVASDKAPEKKCNAQRQLVWYCAYRLHGKRLDALMSAYAGNGRWDRSAREPDAPRLGRQALRTGTRTGHSAVPLKSRICDSYVRFVSLAKPMTAIYRQALREDFGCRVRTVEDGRKEYFHPQGLAFPTYQQYRYWVLKEFGIADVQKRRFGEERFRNRLAPSKGSFSQEGANYCERTEADAYYVKELPKQLLSTEPGAPLVVCKINCTTTGLTTGIGVSHGGERAEAYRLAKFSAAIPKSEFFRILGLPYAEGDWPGFGLSPREIVDRGPGTSPTVAGSSAIAPAITEMAPSYSGQAKASVESSHPRHTQTAGAPTHVCSDLNVFQLFVREVLWAQAKNHATDASSRLTPDMIAAGVAGNPVAIANYLLARGRSDAVPVSFEQAIREFLTPVSFQLKDDGLWLDGMPYSHQHLHAHGLPSRVPKGQVYGVRGFVYPLTLHVAWVDMGGNLYEVQPQLRIRDKADQLRFTLSELASLSDRLREIRAQQRENGAAALAEAEQKLFEQFGIRWDAGRRISGPPPSRRGRRENAPTDVGARTRGSTA